jgi:hypothetical protein
MQLRRVGVPIAAGATVAVAAWLTAGSLDVIERDGAAVRVAMLPSPLRLLILLAFVPLIAFALTRARTRAGTPGAPAYGTDLALPAFTLAALILPYLPWLADALPGLRVLAGPFRFAVWAIVAGQIVWIAIRRRTSTAAPAAPARPPRIDRGLLAVFAGGLLAYGLAGVVVTGRGLSPRGDEPHYLVIAQSLWRDGDLKIANNHQRRDYFEYYGADLAPHYRTTGVDGEIYSVHPVGLPLLLAPAYGLAGYRGVVWMLAAAAALAAALMWRWMARLAGSRASATFAWFAAALSAPYLLNSFTVYPEIIAGLAVVVAFAGVEEGAVGRPWSRGLAVAALPWLSTMYAAMAAALATVLALRLTGDRTGLLARLRRAAPIVAPLAVSLAAWFALFFLTWGSPSPSAPYGGAQVAAPRHLAAGGPGLLLDQEYGLLVHAPILGAAFAGLAVMARRPGRDRRLAIELTAVFGALLATVGSFHTWWGGTAAPGRPVASGLLLWGVPLAVSHARTARGSLARAALRTTLLLSVSIALFLLAAQNGRLAANDRDGSSRLLEWLSPDWPLWAMFPTFIGDRVWLGWMTSLVWIVVVLFAAAVLMRARSPSRSEGAATLLATAAGAAAVVAAGGALAALAGGRLDARSPLGARRQVKLLTDYDGAARPLAILYDPLRLVPASELPSFFTMSASRASAGPRQPVPLVFNARFALPAGRYALAVHASAAAHGTIGLQVGRQGPALKTWAVDVAPGRAWQTSFELPIDATFVGFRASTEIAGAVREIRLVPEQIVNARSRLSQRDTLAAVAGTSSSIFFHDTHTWIEETGFWTRGRSTAELTFVPATIPAQRLSVHCGPMGGTVTLTSPGWRATLVVQPGVVQQVEVPVESAGAAVPMKIETSTGFVPSEHDPSSSDRRVLGCWFEVRRR